MTVCGIPQDIFFQQGRYAHPVFSKEGGWPPKIDKYLGELGKLENYPSPRLPPFTTEEIKLVRGTYDFYGLNHYTTSLVRRPKPGEKIGPWPFYGSEELQMVLTVDPNWKMSDADWFALYPEGLRKQLHWLNRTYDVKEIIITENGIPTTDPGLQDWLRVEYFRDYLDQVLLAIDDGVPVTGYTAWSLMDNFEWFGGYSSQFGIYAVNFSHPLRTRTPRESARYFVSVVRSRSVHSTNHVLKFDEL